MSVETTFELPKPETAEMFHPYNIAVQYLQYTWGVKIDLLFVGKLEIASPLSKNKGNKGRK